MKVSSHQSGDNFPKLLRKRVSIFWTEAVRGPHPTIKEEHLRQGVFACPPFPPAACATQTNCTHRPLPPCQVCQS